MYELEVPLTFDRLLCKTHLNDAHLPSVTLALDASLPVVSVRMDVSCVAELWDDNALASVARMNGGLPRHLDFVRPIPLLDPQQRGFTEGHAAVTSTTSSSTDSLFTREFDLTRPLAACARDAENDASFLHGIMISVPAGSDLAGARLLDNSQLASWQPARPFMRKQFECAFPNRPRCAGSGALWDAPRENFYLQLYVSGMTPFCHADDREHQYLWLNVLLAGTRQRHAQGQQSSSSSPQKQLTLVLDFGREGDDEGGRAVSHDSVTCLAYISRYTRRV